ncbi:MAG: type II toxin-antitoxin system VapC family toxin [Spirochaetaceae bacterium]|nr:type II toxin-antitoxin system VapC family toxin [Spirochaetaceae bacterium]
MSGNIVPDSNIIIGFLDNREGFPDLSNLPTDTAIHISVITELELLSFSKLDSAAESIILRFLSDLTVMPLTDAIKQKTIAFRRSTNRKLPDSIIAATAIVLGATLITRDNDLLKANFPGLIAQSFI